MFGSHVAEEAFQGNALVPFVVHFK